MFLAKNVNYILLITSLLHSIYRHKTRWLQILPSLIAEIQELSYMYKSAIIQRSGNIHPDRAEVWIEAQYVKIAVQSWTGYVSIAWLPWHKLIKAHILKSDTVSSSKAPSPAILPYARQSRSGRNHSPQRGTAELDFTAFVTSWPAQDVTRIKAIHITFTELNFLRSTINYYKAYKDI